MYRYSQLVGRVCRHREIAGQCLGSIVAVSRADQQTVCIVAAGCTNGVYKRLVIGHGITGREVDFVHALKYQMLVIVLEVGCNLSPQLFKGTDLGGILFPVFIVVGVDYGIHAIVYAVVYYFLDSCQICVSDRAVKGCHICRAGSTSHIPPGDRNTNGIEAGLLDFLDHAFGCDNIAPGSFNVCRGRIAGPGIGAVQRITQVPAQAHIFDLLNRGHACRICHRDAGRQCSGHRRTDCRSCHCAQQLLHKLHGYRTPSYQYYHYSTISCASCQEILPNHPMIFSVKRQNAQIMFSEIVQDVWGNTAQRLCGRCVVKFFVR